MQIIFFPKKILLCQMEVREVLGFNAKEKKSFLIRQKRVVFTGPWAQSAHRGAGTGAVQDQASLQPLPSTGAEQPCGGCRWEQGCVGKARGQLESPALGDKCAPELPVCVCGPCHNPMVNLPLVDYSFWCSPLYSEQVSLWLSCEAEEISVHD